MRIVFFSWMILASATLPFFGAGCGTSTSKGPQVASAPAEPPPAIAATTQPKTEAEGHSAAPPPMPKLLGETPPLSPASAPPALPEAEPLTAKPMPVKPEPALHGNPLREPSLPSESDNPMRHDGASLPPGSALPLKAEPAKPAAASPADLFSEAPAKATATGQQTPVHVASQADTPSPAWAPTKPPTAPELTKESQAEPRPPVEPATPPVRLATGKSPKNDKTAFDPIKENGPIFVDWPKPILAVVITGCEDGYMEPCGCAGLDRMKGGLSRRYTMIETLRKQKGWPVVAVDVGGLTKGYGPQAEIKFRFTVDALRAMGYEAIGFGSNDLRLPAGELVSVAVPPSPFLSANVGLLGFSSGVTERTRIAEVNGIKVGVTSVLGKAYQSEINNQEIEMMAPEAALAAVVPELKKKCNLLILLAYATKDESIALAKKFPDFGLVVTSNGAAEPPAKPERIEGTQSLLIEVGEKAMNAVVLGFYDNPKQPVRYQRVPLDSRFAASDAMKRLMMAYQDQLEMLGLSGLSLRPVSHPQKDLNGDFVGSQKCEACHEASYDVWKKSKHAHAWPTLLHTDPPRNHDPECISCHVTGWHPMKHFPYKGGFVSEKETPQLAGVGCESCHGPGGAHIAAESGGDTALQKKLQQAMTVTLEEARTNHAKWCQNCHDLDNSPDFDFDTYWPEIAHPESE